MPRPAVPRAAVQSTAGLPLAEAAEQLAVHPESLRRIRRRYGITPPQPPRPAEPFDVAFALMLLEDDCPYPEVARTVGISVKRLKATLPGYGDARPGGREARLVLAEVRRDPKLWALHQELLRPAESRATRRS